jgi:hypothetical protein
MIPAHPIHCKPELGPARYHCFAPVVHLPRPSRAVRGRFDDQQRIKPGRKASFIAIASRFRGGDDQSWRSIEANCPTRLFGRTPRGATRSKANPKPTWRRAQADVAPNPNPCQLFPIATHCRFEPFQTLSRSRKRHSPLAAPCLFKWPFFFSPRPSPSRRARFAGPRLWFLTTETIWGRFRFSQDGAKNILARPNPASLFGRVARGV